MRKEGICLGCQRVFTYSFCPSSKSPGKFCSMACRTRIWRGKNHPRYLGNFGVEPVCRDHWGYIQRAYKLSKDKFDELLKKQNYCCGICGNPLDLTLKKSSIASVVIDHNRQCCNKDTSCGKCVRGILHRGCNTALGFFKDNPAICRRAAEYLEQKSDKNKD